MNNKLLDIKNLSVRFRTDEGDFYAVDDVSFHINKGEIVGLVGESGCGKSVTALSILRLIPFPLGIIEEGEIFFKGEDILALKPEAVQKIRGQAISMIFQEPLAALSPLQRIGQQMIEALQLHPEALPGMQDSTAGDAGGPHPMVSGNVIRKLLGRSGARTKLPRQQAWKIAETWLEKVRISDAAERMFSYPFQLSGGMQQRIMIAMALMLGPDLIIADEPTTALDVTIQAQIFQLIREVRQEQTSILLITHDMGVIWDMCDRVLVMYASSIVEEGTVVDIFTHPAHPYTRGLLRSIPKLSGKTEELATIPGNVPSPLDYPKGCRFQDRCEHAFVRCKEEKPEFITVGDNHRSACFIAEQIMNG